MRLLGTTCAIFFIAVATFGCVIVQTPSPENATSEPIENHRTTTPASPPTSPIEVHTITETVIQSTTPPDTPAPTPPNVGFVVPIPNVTEVHSDPSIAELVEQLRPSVVHLTNRGSSSGSGVVISPNGLVATNAHVADCCKSFTAVVDGRQYQSTVLAIDDRADLALVQIDSTQLFESARFADPDDVTVGDEVIALGFPLRLGHDLTATKGIISAYRDLQGSEFLQHDAAINPGNSGGPLIPDPPKV